MSRIPKSAAHKLGMAPGSPVFTGRKKMDKVHVSVIDYDRESYSEKQSNDVRDAFASKTTKTVSWITVTGLHESKKIEELAQYYGVHPLVCEDILNIHQRPKVEIYDDYVYLTLKAIDYQPNNQHVSIDQLSFLLGNGFVILFQEEPVPFFDALKKRIKEAKGRIRERGADYLLYALIDIVVDHYFVNAGVIGDQIEKVEEELMTSAENKILTEIYAIKREALFMRKSVWPLREMIGKLEKSESELITPSIRPYLRDVYDHTIQVIDSVETIRELLTGMQDLYLSSVSNKMNQVMKMLTVIATIFIPLTFVAGIYGMNFEYMPELSWDFGYFYILALMFAIGMGMWIYFRRKKWV